MISRRTFIKRALFGGAAIASINLPVWASQNIVKSESGTSGALDLSLMPKDENGLMLPKGFKSKILAKTGQMASKNSSYKWHRAPDGGAIFPEPGSSDKKKPCGWVYVSNAETPDTGGAGALMFHPDGRLIDSYSILDSTQWNCAGGATPWGTWLSCEEHPFGRVWECDPWGRDRAKVLPAMGVFKHEAAAVDPSNNDIYLTEDVSDGLLYKFVSDTPNVGGKPDLEKGTLFGLSRDGEKLIWRKIEKPLLGEYVPTRYQVKDPLTFNGGEGCVYNNGVIVFATKGDNCVWAYDIRKNNVSKLYDFSKHKGAVLSGVDNVAIGPNGDIVIAEDGGNMELVGLSKSGTPYPMLRIMGQDESEITGPAFSPDGTRLYFSSQRGKTGTHDGGITYEVSGPFTQI